MRRHIDDLGRRLNALSMPLDCERHDIVRRVVAAQGIEPADGWPSTWHRPSIELGVRLAAFLKEARHTVAGVPREDVERLEAEEADEGEP